MRLTMWICRRKNIDSFLEELKRDQHERELLGVRDLAPQVSVATVRGSFDAGDPLTTNIFVGNMVGSVAILEP